MVHATVLNEPVPSHSLGFPYSLPPAISQVRSCFLYCCIMTEQRSSLEITHFITSPALLAPPLFNIYLPTVRDLLVKPMGVMTIDP